MVCEDIEYNEHENIDSREKNKIFATKLYHIFANKKAHQSPVAITFPRPQLERWIARPRNTAEYTGFQVAGDMEEI